jgi:hypothetical protein
MYLNYYNQNKKNHVLAVRKENFVYKIMAKHDQGNVMD